MLRPCNAIVTFHVNSIFRLSGSFNPRVLRLIDHVLHADKPGPWMEAGGSSHMDARLRCSAELQLSRSLWTHLLSLASSSSEVAEASISQQLISQIDLLDLWLKSPLLRAYEYSDDEILSMITNAPSKDGMYDLSSFRAGFYRVFAVANSNCSAEDFRFRVLADVHEQQQQPVADVDQQQQQPVVIDVGSSVGYFPFLSLSLGAHVYVSSVPNFAAFIPHLTPPAPQSCFRASATCASSC